VASMTFDTSAPTSRAVRFAELIAPDCATARWRSGRQRRVKHVGQHLAPPNHLAFAATSYEQIEGFHREGLAAGGRDNGAPGPRPKYSPGYYGAFLLDPDGHNVEAVWHAPDEG
jgi:catechol 2,3-dioxygenase-like lactoylglutathione lyase family enzyme